MELNKTSKSKRSIILFLSLAFIITITSFKIGFGEDLRYALPTTNDIANLGLSNIDIRKDYSFRDFHFQRIFVARAQGVENPGVSINVKLYATTSTTSIEPRYNSYIKEGYNCNKGVDWLRCSKIESINEYKSEYKYRGKYYFIKILNYDKCDAASCYKKSAPDMKVLVLFIGSVFNFTNPIDSIKEPLTNLIVARLSGNGNGKQPEIEILSPKDKTTFYYSKGKDFNFDVKVKGKGDYIGADYTANGVMIGGKVTMNNGIGTINIHLKPDEIFSVATINAYARYGSKEITKSIKIYFKEKSSVNMQNNQNKESYNPNNKNNAKNNDANNLNNKNGFQGNGVNSNQKPNQENLENKRDNIKNKIKNKINIPKKVKIDLNEVDYINKIHSDDIKSTKQKLESLSKKLKVKTIKTSYSSIKLAQDDEKVNAKKESGLWFKIKYGVNKHILDPIVDKINDKIPVLGKLKDYFKSDKDTNLFNPKEETKKTAKDLNVDLKSAQLYNQFSGVEDREKALSVAKNSINIPNTAKPMEFAINALTAGTKKIIAKYYKKEYEYVIDLAKFYRERGMKWKDVHKAVINDIDEIKEGVRGLNAGKEFTASQYLNTMSKGEYKNINSRIHLYILQAMENGELK